MKELKNISLKRDALKDKHCITCAKWHNPEGTEVAYCVAKPATVFIVGVVPQGNILEPNAPVKVAHQVKSYVPMVGTDDGCWEHTPLASLIN